jgi:phage antirepressor YoqD-like protein
MDTIECKGLTITIMCDTPMIDSKELAREFGKKHQNFRNATEIYLNSLPTAKSHILLAKDGKSYLFDLQGFTSIAPYLVGNKNTKAMEIAEAFEEAYHKVSRKREEKATTKLKQTAMQLRDERDDAMEKVKALDALCNTKDYYSFSDAAKLIGIPRKKLIRALEEHEYVVRKARAGRYNQTTLIPKAKYMADGYGEGLFVLKQLKFGPAWKNEKGETCQSTTMWPYLTEKGIVKMQSLLRRWGEIAA